MTQFEIDAAARAYVHEFMAPYVAELNAAIDELEGQVHGVNGHDGLIAEYAKMLDNHEQALEGIIDTVELIVSPDDMELHADILYRDMKLPQAPVWTAKGLRNPSQPEPPPTPQEIWAEWERQADGSYRLVATPMTNT